MANIPFTSNYTDLSNQRGYQFQFFCRKCGNGYMSTFQANALSGVANVANVAATIFGGIFGRAAQSAAAIQSQVAGPQHDSALDAAVREISPIFKQCSRCGSWVCEPICWNKKAGLCENCAPDLDEELAAAQAEAAREQIQTKAREVDWTKSRKIDQVSGAVCGSCGTKSQGGKFCPECGAAYNAKKKCGSCGHEAEGSPKFCPECGGKY